MNKSNILLKKYLGFNKNAVAVEDYIEKRIIV